MVRRRSPVHVIKTSPIPYNVGCSTQHFLTSLPAKQRESGGHSNINEEAYFSSLELQVSGLEQTVPLIAPIPKYPLQKGWTVTCSKAFGHPVQDTLPAHRRSFAMGRQKSSQEAEEAAQETQDKLYSSLTTEMLRIYQRFK